jgi:hypothetical protein
LGILSRFSPGVCVRGSCLVGNQSHADGVAGASRLLRVASLALLSCGKTAWAVTSSSFLLQLPQSRSRLVGPTVACIGPRLRSETWLPANNTASRQGVEPTVELLSRSYANVINQNTGEPMLEQGVSFRGVRTCSCK